MPGRFDLPPVYFGFSISNVEGLFDFLAQAEEQRVKNYRPSTTIDVAYRVEDHLPGAWILVLLDVLFVIPNSFTALIVIVSTKRLPTPPFNCPLLIFRPLYRVVRSSVLPQTKSAAFQGKLTIKSKVESEKSKVSAALNE